MTFKSLRILLAQELIRSSSLWFGTVWACVELFLAESCGRNRASNAWKKLLKLFGKRMRRMSGTNLSSVSTDRHQRIRVQGFPKKQLRLYKQFYWGIMALFVWGTQYSLRGSFVHEGIPQLSLHRKKSNVPAKTWIYRIIHTVFRKPWKWLLDWMARSQTCEI